MKTNFLKYASAILIMTTWLAVACNNTSDKKVEEAKEDVNEAKQDLQEAKNDYNAEWQKFRDDARLRITENNNKIAEYRIKITNEKPAVQAKYEKRIAELEVKNHELEVKIDSYKDEGHEHWESFKREFNHDMDELGHAIGDIFKDNEK